MKTSDSIKPIKRTEALLKYSREHYYGLLLCRRIRKALANNIRPQRISAYLIFFFEHDLKSHFKSEEDDLFSKLKEDDLLLKRVLREHRQVHFLIDEIRSDMWDTELLAAFADYLEAHIRFEERDLFNVLQNELSTSDLSDLVKKNNAGKPNDVSRYWKDKFWDEKISKTDFVLDL